MPRNYQLLECIAAAQVMRRRINLKRLDVTVAFSREVVAKVVEAKSVAGLVRMRTMATEVTAMVNEQARAGGFSPAQWALGRQPRRAGGEQFNDDQYGHIWNSGESTRLPYSERVWITGARPRQPTSALTHPCTPWHPSFSCQSEIHFSCNESCCFGVFNPRIQIFSG